MSHTEDRSAPVAGRHRLLIAMAVLAVVYCLAAPYAANLVAHFSH